MCVMPKPDVSSHASTGIYPSNYQGAPWEYRSWPVNKKAPAVSRELT